MARETFYTAVDLGNSKVASIVARVGTEGELKVVGTGIVPSQGMHRGRIERIDEVQTAVRASLDEAQRYIGRGVVANVYAGVSGNHISCINTKDTVANSGGVKDINTHLLEQLIKSSVPRVDRNKDILHIIPMSYNVDGLTGMRNPVGLHADEVQVEAHVVLGEAMALKNTVKAVQSAKVSVRSLVLQSLASAESTLTGDEREMGVVFVDIGSGTSDVVIYRQGSPWYSAVIPVGGDQLTKDLSVALRVPVYLAEETKIKWGHAEPDALGPDEEVVIPSFQGQPRRIFKRKRIADPLNARVVELLKLILFQVRQAGLRQLPAGGLVISGGCAELRGFQALAKKTLGGSVRIAYPSGIAGLPTQLRKPAYSAAVGLLLWGIKHQGEKRTYRGGRRPASKGKPMVEQSQRESEEQVEVQVG